jgi:hypothetical protein
MRWALVLLAACRFEAGHYPDDATVVPEDTSDATMIDAALPDATPPDARVCAPPAPGCAAFTCQTSSSCYYICGSGTFKSSWAGAKGSCEGASINGCIVTINDQAEQDCITAATVPTFSTFVWIGYHQTSTNDEPLGNWAWQCPPSTYVQPGWGDPAGEPTDTGGNEDCAALTGNGAWFDGNCTGTARFVCEVP